MKNILRYWEVKSETYSYLLWANNILKSTPAKKITMLFHGFFEVSTDMLNSLKAWKILPALTERLTRPVNFFYKNIVQSLIPSLRGFLFNREIIFWYKNIRFCISYEPFGFHKSTIIKKVEKLLQVLRV